MEWAAKEGKTAQGAPVTVRGEKKPWVSTLKVHKGKSKTFRRIKKNPWKENSQEPEQAGPGENTG